VHSVTNFHTREVSLDGTTRSPLARVNQNGPKVGKYGVDLVALETGGIDLMTPTPNTKIFVIDEIGKMECLSPKFTASLQELLGNILW